MDWKEYEHEIEAQFRQTYPTARVTHNAKVVGKFSKVDRQIDLLIEETASDFAFRVVVDAKYRGRKIDVADVEAFIGLTRDVEAHTGMLVALEGYTPAAVNRAHNDDLDIILDVLSLDELKELQGPTAIPYSGDYGVSVAAPFGWIVDGTRRPNMLASLYQRGLTFEEAVRSNEWMYINFWKKPGNEISDLEALLKFQAAYMLKESADAEIEITEQSRNQRLGVRTLIRRFKKPADPVLEYTGFIDFPDFILMCVLFTPETLERKNLRKLRFVLRDSFPISVRHDHSARIQEAEARLMESSSLEERARFLAEIGFCYREMGELQKSRKALEESLALVPNHSYALEQLRVTLVQIGDKSLILEAMSRVLRLDPHNPAVFDHCIAYTGGGAVGDDDLLPLFDSLRNDYPEDKLVHANCDFYSGKVKIDADPMYARERFLRAEASFRELLPPDHQVFDALRSAFKEHSSAAGRTSVDK